MERDPLPIGNGAGTDRHVRCARLADSLRPGQGGPGGVMLAGFAEAKGIWPVGLRRCIPAGRCRRERLVRAARGPWGRTGTGEPRGVYLRIVGELRKPGVRVFAASVRSMQRHPAWGRTQPLALVMATRGTYIASAG
jgi:hypothetical protein